MKIQKLPKLQELPELYISETALISKINEIIDFLNKEGGYCEHKYVEEEGHGMFCQDCRVTL